MLPSEQIKALRRAGIIKFNANERTKLAAKGVLMDRIDFTMERIEQGNELSPFFWIYGILEYLDSQYVKPSES